LEEAGKIAKQKKKKKHTKKQRKTTSQKIRKNGDRTKKPKKNRTPAGIPIDKPKTTPHTPKRQHPKNGQIASNSFNDRGVARKIRRRGEIPPIC